MLGASKLFNSEDFIRRLHHANIENNYFAMEKNIGFVSSEISDYLPDAFILKRHNAGVSTYGETLRLVKNPKVDVIKFLEKYLITLTTNVVVTRFGDWLSAIESDSLFVKVKDTNNSVKVDVMGDESAGIILVDYIRREFDVITVTVDWVTSKDMDTTSLPLVMPRGITDSSYPFIDGGVDDFVDSFLDSDENVLLLIGPPGCGKSVLISYIVARSEMGAMITYDPEIMSKDTIFANFIESNNGSFVMEDADAFLGGRTEGNLSMHRFLNVSSGIVSMKNKKLIFSTNLENTDEIDPALLRPGRCFDIVQFRKLTVSEGNNFLKDHNFEGTVDKDMTLAELYNMTGRNRKVKRRSIGFV
jgi:hypothetical protein